MIPKPVLAYFEYPLWEWSSPRQGATADPAAGSDPAEITVPAGKKWLLLCIAATLVTDATVATRYPILNIKIDGTTIVYKLPGASGQTASTTITWNATGSNITHTGCIPFLPGGIELLPGTKISISTTNLQAADNWGILYYIYKELDA